MFYDIKDSTERHFTLHYYLFLVGWDKQPPDEGNLSMERIVALRAIAKATALEWVSRRYSGHSKVIEWPK